MSTGLLRRPAFADTPAHGICAGRSHTDDVVVAPAVDPLAARIVGIRHPRSGAEPPPTLA